MPSSLRTLIRRRTEASGQEKWHQQIESFRHLSEYLTEGRLPPDPSWIDALKRSTAMLMNATLTEEAPRRYFARIDQESTFKGHRPPGTSRCSPVYLYSARGVHSKMFLH